MIWFVIPALNEHQSMAPLAASLAAACDGVHEGYRVVIVDDGSTDGTSDAAIAAFGDARCSVVRFEINRGPGAAMDAGLRRAVADSPDGARIVTLEADGTSDLAILPDLLALLDSAHDLALASPYAPGGDVRGTSTFRHVLSRGANFLCDHWLGLHGVSTYSSFYRVHTREILVEAIERYGDRMIQEPGFTYAVEMLTKLKRVGARIGEVPMVLDATKMKRKSRMPVVKTTLRYFVLFARLGPALPAARRQAPRTADGQADGSET